MNLFSNACDAMKGRPAPELRLDVRKLTEGPRRGAWEFRITDNGSGMSPELRGQVFTPFFTTKPKGEGTGLGLSITRSIVRRHGGQITLESEPGKGTSFIILLPDGVEAAAPVAGSDEAAH